MASLEASAGLAMLDLERAAAWKYVGYPGFSSLMASSNDCFAIRQFGTLNVRVLLKLQNEIVVKERALWELDEESKWPTNGVETGCGSFLLDAGGPREQLLKEISDLLKDYNERVVTFFQMQDRPQASADQVHNLRSWLSHYENAIEYSEQDFLYERDLICPRVSRRTHFGKWMQNLGFFRLASVGSGGNSTRYYDWNVWKSFGGFWLLLCTIGALLGPLWAMSFTSSTWQKLTIVSAATVGSSCLAIFGTTLKPSQRSVLVAGYCGLTMLMLGLTPAWATKIGSSEAQSPVSTTTTTNLQPSRTTAPIVTKTLTTSSHGPKTSQTTSYASQQTGVLDTHQSSGLSDGALAGIVVAVSFVIIVSGASFWLFFRRRRPRKILDIDKEDYPMRLWEYSEYREPIELPSDTIAAPHIDLQSRQNTLDGGTSSVASEFARNDGEFGSEDSVDTT